MRIGRSENRRRKESNLVVKIGAISVFLIILISSAVSAASAAQISVMPSYQEVSKGAFFTVDIFVGPEASEVVAAAQYKLRFNNTLLNATSLTEGDFFTGFDTMTFGVEINNITGRIGYGETIWPVGDVGVTDPRILTTITFQAIAEEDGVCELNFTEVKLSDPYAVSIPTNTSNGNVSVRTGGICGDVNDDESVNMLDVIDLLYYVSYPGEYAIGNAWAADVNCDTCIDMLDEIDLLYYVSYSGEYELNCCNV